MNTAFYWSKIMNVTVTSFKFIDIAIPETLFSKIKNLSETAVASYLTKKTAKPYVEQLNFLRSSLPKITSLRQTFDKLVGSVEAASGQGRDKDHWLMFVSRNLILLEDEFNRLERAPVNEIS